MLDIPLLPFWILGAPWLLGVVELIRTPRSNPRSPVMSPRA